MIKWSKQRGHLIFIYFLWGCCMLTIRRVLLSIHFKSSDLVQWGARAWCVLWIAPGRADSKILHFFAIQCILEWFIIFFPLRWLTRYDLLMSEDPSLFCEKCFKALHYKGNDKAYPFSAYQYCGVYYWWDSFSESRMVMSIWERIW